MKVYCVFQVVDEGANKLVEIFIDKEAAEHFVCYSDSYCYVKEWEIV